MSIDDMIGGGNETFKRVMTAKRIEFDFGTWDIGSLLFKGRQISQVPNREIVCDMEHYKHVFEQIYVSKTDKTFPELKRAYPIPRRRWESGLVCGSLLSTVIISAGRISSKTGVTDSSIFAETQQSGPRSEGD